MNVRSEYLSWMVQDVHRRLWCEEQLKHAIARELRWVNLFAHEALVVMAQEAVSA
jgi:hypothetical protein